MAKRKIYELRRVYLNMHMHGVGAKVDTYTVRCGASRLKLGEIVHTMIPDSGVDEWQVNGARYDGQDRAIDSIWSRAVKDKNAGQRIFAGR